MAAPDVVGHVRLIEQAIVDALAEVGVDARARVDDGPGLHRRLGRGAQDRIDRRARRRGVATHGFAVNVDNDLRAFESFNPCGLAGVQMTSLAREAPQPANGERCASAGGSPAGCASCTAPASGSSAAAESGSSPRERRCRLMSSATRSRSNPGGMDVLSVLGPEVRPLRERKPPWFKVPAPGSTRYRELSAMIRSRSCTPSARRPRARTSASAGSAAPRRS